MTHSVTRETFLTPTLKAVASPAKALQDIVNKKLSGRLTIRDPQNHSVYWRVYAGAGQIHFATSTVGQKERLLYIWQKCCPEIKPLKFQPTESDYEFISRNWQSGKLSLSQARKLIFLMTQDAWVQLLAIPQAILQFDKTVGLDPLLLSIPVQQILLPTRSLISQWVQIRAEVSSPFQKPYITDATQFWEILQAKVNKPEKIQALSVALSQDICLYEVARQLKMEVLALAKLLRSLIKMGVVGMKPYHCQTQDQRPMIACIDDSKSVQRNVRLILEAAGYQVLGITDPAQALSLMARYKPALVLMDINMSEIDGYELCRILRQSSLLKEIPIVMLTGRDGLIDRVRSRMVGANDYITKPFQSEHLLSILNRELSSKSAVRPSLSVSSAELYQSCSS